MCALFFLSAGVRAESGRPGLAVPHIPAGAPQPEIRAGLGEAVWAHAAVIEALTLSPGNEVGATDAMRVEVRLLWDRTALYVRFVSRQSQPFLVPYGTRRDADHHRGDVVEVFLDPVGDGRQLVEIQVNPEGGELDQISLATAEPVVGKDNILSQPFRDRDWWMIREWTMPGLRTASRVAQEGGDWIWVADLAIPAAGLLRRNGSQEFAAMPLRANFLRYGGPLDATGRERETWVSLNWADVRRGWPHMAPASMGWLHLVEGRAPDPSLPPDNPAGGTTAGRQVTPSKSLR